MNMNTGMNMKERIGIEEMKEIWIKDIEWTNEIQMKEYHHIVDFFVYVQEVLTHFLWNTV